MQQICLPRRNDEDGDDDDDFECVCRDYEEDSDADSQVREKLTTAAAMYTSSSWLNAARAVINYTSF